MLDKEKVDARLPDVTNQTDKEPARPWTAAQLRPQLCTVVEPGPLLRGRKEEKEKGRGGGKEEKKD